LAALRDDRTALDAVVATLTGQILQAPSAVSAIKVDGRRAYDRVRAGERVQLKQRAVTVHRFEIGELREARAADGSVVFDVDATVVCSSGTYVRALARDVGAALSVGGHLVALRRTHVGPFDVTDAVSTESLKAAEVTAAQLMTPTEVAARLFPLIMLDEVQERDLGHGKRLDLTPEQGLSDGSSSATLAAAVAPSGRLVGLVEVKGGRTRVVTNFPVVATPSRVSEDQA
jgi:tRNA pseudouridine55 synthase